MSFSVADTLQLIDEGQIAEAVAICEGLREDPEQGPDALHVLGVAAAHEGRAHQAISLVSEAVEKDPENVERRFNLGTMAMELGSADIAVEHLRWVVEAVPEDPAAHTQLGTALARAGCYEEAVAAQERAVELAPREAGLWANLAGAYLGWGKIEAAEAGNAYAVSLDPDHAELRFNLGGTYVLQNKLHEARATFEAALGLDPEHGRARTSLGVVLRSLGDLEEGRAEQERAYQTTPQDIDVRWNLALSRLYDGDWTGGWPLYEARRERNPQLGREGWGERWDGSPKPNDTVVVEREQGFGDTLMFSRFLAEARARVGRLVFRCQERLTPFLEESLDAAGVEIEPFELEPYRGLYAPLMSLPHLLRVESDICSGRPYVRAAPERIAAWAERLGAKTKPRIGLIWQGNPGFRNDKLRSMPLAAFAPLLELEGVEVISLQQVHGVEQIDALPDGLRPRTLEGDVDAGGAFLDTAAIMANLDLVVTTDTAPAHLAGALGVPTALVLSHHPDWRWGQGPEAWYPRMRAFRQTTAKDWSGPVAELTTYVQALLR